MLTVRAVDANRQFSSVLKQVSQGKEFIVISRGKPVATILPFRRADNAHVAARGLLLERLCSQEPSGEVRSWTRDELYDRTS